MASEKVTERLLLSLQGLTTGGLILISLQRYNSYSICIYIYIYIKATRGKWEVGVNRRNGKCVTNAASTTDWPHLVASSTYNDAMQ